MDQIALIRDKTQLHGTCYFELIPGKYRRKCWNDNSLFLTEKTWGFLEPIVRRFEPRYDHYAFVDVPADAWRAVTSELRVLARKIRRATNVQGLPADIGYFWPETQNAFAADFSNNRAALATLFDDLSGWVESQLRKHKYVAILGI